MKPVSVLHFSNTAVRAGAEEHMLTLLRGLDRRQFSLHVVCPPDVAAKLAPDLPEDVELLPLELRTAFDAGAALRLAAIVRKRRIAILHSHMFYSSVFASPIGKLSGVPVIIETPHVREQWRRNRLKSSFVVDRLVGRFVDYFIAVSEANARFLVEQKRLPRKKVVVIQNGCDLTRYTLSHTPASELRKRLEFGDRDPVLAVLARLEPQKGHRVLLEALPSVRAEFPSIRVVVVGEGRLRGELERLSNALGLDGSVRFVGYQPHVTDWLALADFTVLPSFYEGLPLVAIESLAAGRPVVATAVDGTPEVVVHEKTGLLVEAGDAPHLAGAIRRLLRDEPLRRDLASTGRQWVAERFDQQRQVQRTQALYLRALNGIPAQP